MRCMQCERVVATSRDGLCAVCALHGELEVDELVGEVAVERVPLGDKVMEVKGLPLRARLDDATGEHSTDSSPGSLPAPLSTPQHRPDQG